MPARWQDHVATMGLEVDASAQPGGRQPAAGVQKPAVLAAVTATRDADPRGRQRAMGALELGEAFQAAVARVDIDHQ